jgi:hypothetical protein
MADTRIITYRGSAERLGVLTQLLHEQGVWVAYHPPEEKHGAREAVREVVLNLTASGAYDGMEAAVHEFRERFPGTWVDIR